MVPSRSMTHEPANPRRPGTTEEARIPGPFDGETVTRRRLMSSTVYIAGTIAAAAVGVPVLGFAVGPIFRRLPRTWQPVGPVGVFSDETYRPAVIRLTSDSVGEVGLSTVFVRRRNPAVDTEPHDRRSDFIAVSSRCAHVGCPVNYVDAAQSFVCPGHGGVYDFRGLHVGGPPPRPSTAKFQR